MKRDHVHVGIDTTVINVGKTADSFCVPKENKATNQDCFVV